MGLCLKIYPLQCNAKLIDLTTNDYCEALIYRIVSVSVDEAGLDDRYYTDASINIQDAGNSNISMTLSK